MKEKAKIPTGPEPRPFGPAGPGFPTFIEEKPVGYFDKPCSVWQRLPYRTDTGGVSPMWLEGREYLTNERIRGMTPERRAWRKKFLSDQVLSAREPVFVPELDRVLNNPFRRFLEWPFKTARAFLLPKVGSIVAIRVVKSVRTFIFLTAAGYGVAYWTLYYCNNWMYYKRGRLTMKKPVVYPDEPGYPFISKKTKGSDFADFGFSKSVLFKSEEEIRANYGNMMANKNK